MTPGGVQTMHYLTRDEAVRALKRLAAGLRADASGASVLRERIAQHDEREALQDALAELGARALLEGVLTL